MPEALLALGQRSRRPLVRTEAALACEEAFPNVLTQAYLDLPYLIATNRTRGRYGQALGLLGTHEARLTWPVEHFRWHAASALIAADQGEHSRAKAEAEHALEWAGRRHSGFRYHASLGLVTEQDSGMIKKLETYATPGAFALHWTGSSRFSLVPISDISGGCSRPVSFTLAAHDPRGPYDW